jgi:hypothetical protein
LFEGSKGRVLEIFFLQATLGNVFNLTAAAGISYFRDSIVVFITTGSRFFISGFGLVFCSIILVF